MDLDDLPAMPAVPAQDAGLLARIAALEAEAAALREKVAEQDWLIRTNPQLPWTTDAAGCTTSVSPRWLETTGLAEEEALGDGWARVIHPDDLAAVRGVWGECLRSGEAGEVVHRMRCADGRYRWMRSRTTPRRDAQGRLVAWHGWTEDIDERRRAEAALRESEARLRRVQRIGRVGGFEIDFRSGLNRRSAEYMNLQGHVGQEAWEQHQDWVRRLHPEDRDRAERRFLRAIADDSGETEYAQEYRIVTPSGEVRWIAARAEIERGPDGRALRMLGAHLDVTELKATEAALAESETRLRLATAAFQGAIYDHDPATDRKIRSGAFEAIFGFDPDELPPTRDAWLGFLHPDDRAAFLAAAAPVYQGQADRFEVEYRARHRDGHWIDLWQRALALRDDAGRLIRVIGSVVDITARKRAEADLAAREALLSAIGDSTPDAIFAKDRAGRYLYANPAALRVLGRTAEEVLGRTDAELFPGLAEAPAIAEADRRALEGGEVTTLEMPLPDRTRGGEARLWRTTRAPMRDPAGRTAGLVGIGRDVTDEREAAAALAAAKEKLELVLESAGLGSWRRHLPSGGLEVDARGLAILGYRPDELEPRREAWEGLIHPDDRPRIMAAWADHYVGRAPAYEAEYRLRHALGHWVWVLARGRIMERDMEGRPLVATGTLLDVTARRDAELALASSEQRLALASAAAGMGVWEWDAETGRTLVNAEYRALYGLPPDAPITTGTWLELIHPDDRARVLAVADAALASGGEYHDEYRIRRADDGRERWLASRGRVVGSGPAPRRMVGVVFDVTERRAEQERQMLLAREVDHRAKNVLAVVRSIVKLTRAEDPRRFAEAVEGRVAALARAHTLLSRDRWTGAGLAAVIREELGPYAGGERLRLTGPELRLKPDAVQPVSIVLHELATNAAKYGALSVPGGSLAVTWRLEGGTLRLDWAERDGPPLAAPPGRRGFGSTVVEATVRGQLGGEARFAWAREGLGCALLLPAERVLAAQAQAGEEEPAAPRDGRAPPEAAVSLRGRRVLLVEDEPLVALEAAAALAELGCEVVGPAGTLAEALRLAGAEAARLDAAVLDVNLAGELSLPVAELLAARGVPVVHVTGYGSLPDGPSGQGRATLSKPLRDGQLGPALRRAIAERPVAAGQALAG